MEAAKVDDETSTNPEKSLRTRTLGATGIVVSELGLGTWGLSGDAYGAVSDGEVEETIARARALGITLFETADSYGARGGDPHAERFERRLGRWLDGDAAAIVCTKIGNDLDAKVPRKRFDAAFLRASVSRSTERLRRAADIVLLHHPSAATLREGIATQAMAALAGEGLVKAWGVACGDAEVARAAIEAGAQVIELAYNVLASRDLHDVTGELLEAKVGVLARSPLAYGLLCGTWSPARTFAEGDHRRDRWTTEDLHRRLAQVAALRPLVHDGVHTVRAVALRYVLSNQLVGAAIVGVRTAAQLEANVRAIGEGPPYLPDKDLAEMGRLVGDD